MTSFEILKHLPPYGPWPEQFSVPGKGIHQEGFVIRIIPPHGESWVGNFQRGDWRRSEYDAVHIHPNSRDIVVIAGGQAYFVDPISRQLIEAREWPDILWSYDVPEHQFLLFRNSYSIFAYGPDGKLWECYLEIIGIRITLIDYPLLSGSVWLENTVDWIQFTLDLTTGIWSEKALD